MSLQSFKRSPKLPDTDVHYLLGHGGFSPEELRKTERQRHLLELLVPFFKKQSQAYYRSTLRSAEEGLAENIAWLHGSLKRKHNFLPGVSLELYKKDLKEEKVQSDFSFSDIAAFVTAPAPESNVKKEKGAERAQWGFLLVNDSTNTTNLLYAETSLKDGQGSLDTIQTIDVNTGAAYGPEHYNLEGRAHLYETAERIFDTLDFGMGIIPEWVSVTELGRATPSVD